MPRIAWGVFAPRIPTYDKDHRLARAFGFKGSVGILYASLMAGSCRVTLVVVRDLVQQSCQIALYHRLSSVVHFVRAL
jgi:hypothetical protein